MRLHIGCGTIFLRSYVNVDVPAPRCHLAADRPDLVERYVTTAAAYYARHPEHDRPASFLAGPAADDYVCDRYGWWDRLPCRDGEAGEVLGRATFEHLSLGEARAALAEVRRVLAPGGLLRLSVPDHAATLALIASGHDPGYARLLLGPRTSDHGYHLMSYTHAGLVREVEARGFAYVEDEPNPHAYPMHCCVWRRLP